MTATGSAWSATPHAMRVLPATEVTVLSQTDRGHDRYSRVVRDAKGHVFRQTVAEGHPLAMHHQAPSMRTEGRTQIFFESFEGYQSQFGLNWIPQGWSKINTPEHAPTDLAVAHNINNSWYVYYTLDGYGFTATPDGECDAFIHFGYDDQRDGYGSSDARQDEWLVTPAITLGSDETLGFYLEAEPFSVYPIDWNTWSVASRAHAECNMKAMITTDNGQSWSEIWDYEQAYISTLDDNYILDSMFEWNRFQISLADYAGQTVKIAFRYMRDEGDFVGNSMCLDAVTIDHPTGSTTDADWTLLGTGTMADGWVVPALTLSPGEFYNPADYIFDVLVYEKADTPGMYKIASPYTSQAFPFLSLNGNTSTPYDIVIDATDPEFVLVQPQISGFEHNNPGAKANRYAVPYYISNAAAYFLEDGNSRNDIIAYGYASTFDAATGKITINYPQYGHNTTSGLDMGYNCGKTQPDPTVITLPSAAPGASWQLAGEGHFVDGFIHPGYFGDPKGHGWAVEVYTKEDAPDLYMIKNPYTTETSSLSGLHSGAVTDVMVKIDASDPAMVLIEPQYSGFNGYMEGQVVPYYIGNTAGYYFSEGTSLSDLQYLNEDSKDTMTNGVITIKKCYFGTDATSNFGYCWVDEDENPLVYPAKIYLPWSTETPEEADDPDAVTTITTDDSRTVIFNLQGMKVNSAVESLPHGIYIINGRKVVR